MSSSDPYASPTNLPLPAADGACDHLVGMTVPNVALFGTDDRQWNIQDLGHSVALYVYPATGVPGRDPAPGWDSIPGAPGCTVQSLGFRDRYSVFARAHVAVFGLSGQSTEEQKEFAQRVKIPFVLLSDPDFALAHALRMPVFEANGTRFYKRLVLVLGNGRISHVVYPVLRPADSAQCVLDWLGKKHADLA